MTVTTKLTRVATVREWSRSGAAERASHHGGDVFSAASAVTAITPSSDPSRSAPYARRGGRVSKRAPTRAPMATKIAAITPRRATIQKRVCANRSSALSPSAPQRAMARSGNDMSISPSGLENASTAASSASSGSAASIRRGNRRASPTPSPRPRKTLIRTMLFRYANSRTCCDIHRIRLNSRERTAKVVVASWKPARFSGRRC